ncbi:hypothetical protein GCM10009642_18890 [Nocardiopsis metallicus]
MPPTLPWLARNSATTGSFHGLVFGTGRCPGPWPWFWSFSGPWFWFWFLVLFSVKGRSSHCVLWRRTSPRARLWQARVTCAAGEGEAERGAV